MQQNGAELYTILGISAVPFFIGLTLLVIWITVVITFYVKIWFACSDINRLTEVNEDIHFWARAKYESDKRLGVITDNDLDAAEIYCKYHIPGK